MARIILVAPYFWPEQIGSAPYCTELAEWLAERGNSVTVLSFRPHYPSTKDFPEWQDGSRDDEYVGPVRVLRVGGVRRGSAGIASRGINDLKFLLHVARRVVDKRFADADAIYAFVPTSLSLFGAKLLARRTGAPLIGVVHDIESGLAASLGMTRFPFIQSLITRVERASLNKADRLVVLTHGMKTVLEGLNIRPPIKVLPLWCAPQPWAPMDSRQDFVVAYSGNFGKKQNLAQLIPVCQMLDQSLPAVKIQFRGEGSERRLMEQAVESNDLSNTSFYPLVEAEALIRTIQSADVHLVPQAANVGNYAVPSKVYTIMASGRPFICISEPGTELARLSETSGAGLCVPPNDRQALYAAIVTLFEDRQRLAAMGKRGLDFVRSNFQKSPILEQYHDLAEAS